MCLGIYTSQLQFNNHMNVSNADGHTCVYSEWAHLFALPFYDEFNTTVRQGLVCCVVDHIAHKPWEICLVGKFD